MNWIVITKILIAEKTEKEVSHLLLLSRCDLTAILRPGLAALCVYLVHSLLLATFTVDC